MLAFKQTMKMKPQQSIYLNRETDQLYEPLRTALRKSTLLGNFLSNDQRNKYEHISPAGKKMRLLSPTEAQNIKNGIFIPANKQLIPTRNIQKILGKNFTPVDFSQKVGEPITPEEFNSRRQGTKEIVYEIKKESHQLYTSRQKSNQRLSKDMALTFVKPTDHEKNAKQQIPRPLFLSHSSRQLIPGRQLTLSLANSPVESSTVKNNSIKAYTFKSGLRKMQQNTSSNQYKYNLFSVVDEGCNNNCHQGCCSYNEIIKNKLQQKSWN